jgi:hypothetical protein
MMRGLPPDQWPEARVESRAALEARATSRAPPPALRLATRGGAGAAAAARAGEKLAAFIIAVLWLCGAREQQGVVAGSKLGCCLIITASPAGCTSSALRKRRCIGREQRCTRPDCREPSSQRTCSWRSTGQWGLQGFLGGGARVGGPREAEGNVERAIATLNAVDSISGLHKRAAGTQPPEMHAETFLSASCVKPLPNRAGLPARRMRRGLEHPGRCFHCTPATWLLSRVVSAAADRGRSPAATHCQPTASTHAPAIITQQAISDSSQSNTQRGEREEEAVQQQCLLYTARGWGTRRVHAAQGRACRKTGGGPAKMQSAGEKRRRGSRAERQRQQQPHWGLLTGRRHFGGEGYSE